MTQATATSIPKAVEDAIYEAFEFIFHYPAPWSASAPESKTGSAEGVDFIVEAEGDPDGTYYSWRTTAGPFTGHGHVDVCDEVVVSKWEAQS